MRLTFLARSQPVRRSPRARPANRRAVASILAMLYVTLFAVLAVGFYEATSLSAQISRNERGLELAQSAADGGMQFLRYQLGQITVPPGTPTNQILNAVAQQLASLMNGTANMQGNGVQVVTYNGVPTVFIPSPTAWTPIDANTGTRFKAMIQQSGTSIVVTVDGAGPTQTVTRAIQVQYQQAPKAGAILNFGVATKGTISTGGSTVIQGLTDPTKGSVLSTDMLSANPVSLGGSGITGDVSVVNPSASVTGGPIGGTSDPVQILQHIHKGVPAPIFPTIDPTPFTTYVTGPWDGTNTLTNVYIPPNTNPKLNSATINGVLWIKPPNVVTFRGGTTINGVIVSDPGPAFDPTNNQISFAGNVSSTPLAQLPSSNPGYSAGLVALTGSFMLVPNFNVSMTGDFGTIGGSIVAGQISMTGNAHGVVQGSVIGMTDNALTLNGHASITISSTGTSQYPTGMNFGNDYTPLPGTYIEVAPW